MFLHTQFYMFGGQLPPQHSFPQNHFLKIVSHPFLDTLESHLFGLIFPLHPIFDSSIPAPLKEPNQTTMDLVCSPSNSTQNGHETYFAACELNHLSTHKSTRDPQLSQFKSHFLTCSYMFSWLKSRFPTFSHIFHDGIRFFVVAVF